MSGWVVRARPARSEAGHGLGLPGRPTRTHAWTVLLGAQPERRRRMVQNLIMLVLGLVVFASSAYVPVASLRTWLQVVAKVNPLSYTVDAARGLALGQP